jgi:hypothetical protein
LRCMQCQEMYGKVYVFTFNLLTTSF